MSRWHTILVVAGIVAVVVLFARAATLDLTVAAVQVEQSTPTPPAVDADAEVTMLRAQLEAARSYDEHLLQTVYWALGTVVAIVLFVVGFGSIFNVRMAERDKASIEAELRGRLGAETATLREGNSEQIQTALSRIEEARLANVREIAEGSQAALDRLNAEAKRLDDRISSHATATSALITSAVSTGTEADRDLDTGLTEKVTALGERLMHQQAAQHHKLYDLESQI